MSFAKKPAQNFDDLLAKAEKYINLEKAQRMKKEDKGGNKEKNEKEKKDAVSSTDWGWVRGENALILGLKTIPPLTVPPVELLIVMQDPLI